VGRRAAGRSAVPLALATLALAACASVPVAPPAEVARRAAAARTYSGRLRVSLKGPELRGRTAALIGFRRPDALRIEIPGPAGARLVAVAQGEDLTAVFPGSARSSAERPPPRGSRTCWAWP
jgi:outer membrane lipoprotein-sorting protein